MKDKLEFVLKEPLKECMDKGDKEGALEIIGAFVYGLERRKD